MTKFRFISVFVLLLFLSCNSNYSDESERFFDYDIANCENKTIIKTFKDELGFISCSTHPSIDAIFYYYFMPIDNNNEFSEHILFWSKGGRSGDEVLDKYVGKLVKVNGNVTDCLYPIYQITSTHEVNIMELTSIKNVKECTSCDNKEYIINILEDEPAFIRKECFEQFGKEKFYFAFDTENISDRYFYRYWGLFPCEELPDEYKVDGLPVKISGKVTNCQVLKGCKEPNRVLVPIYIFELESIKLNN